MVFRKLARISLLLFCPICLTAQTAADYFHRGAQQYIWGQREKAKSEVFTGLRLFPDDPQLNSLAGLLKKEEQQQQQPQKQNPEQNGQQGQQNQSGQTQNQQPEQQQQQQQEQQQQ